MPPSTLSRAHVTAWALTTLTAMGNPVGDGNVPVSVPFGWQGQPNDVSAYFIPWLSLMPGTSRPNPNTPGSFGDSGQQWIASYSVTYNAVNRAEVEWLADTTRKDWTATSRVMIDCGAYGHIRVMQVRSTTIGGILRVRTTDPDYYVQTDSFDIWISKET